MRLTAFYLDKSNIIQDFPLKSFLKLFPTNKEGGLKWNEIKSKVLAEYNKTHRKSFITINIQGHQCFFCTGYSKQHLDQALKEQNRYNKKFLFELNTPYKVTSERELIIDEGSKKPHKIVIKEEYPVDYLFNTEVGNALLNLQSSNNKLFIKLDGDIIKLTSDRLILFRHKGCKCVSCGIEGNILVKVKANGQECYHLELFNKDINGKYLLMTKDHIIPKSKGGADKLENYQTMCCNCNFTKSNTVTNEDITKGKYKNSYIK